MANNYQNSIRLGVTLPQQKDIQGQLDSLVKELNNSKIQLDVNFKDNSVTQTLEKLNTLLNQTKQNASNINLGNINDVLKQVTGEATKLSSEFKNVSSVNLKVNDGDLKSIKVTMKDTEEEAKKLKQTLSDTNNSSFLSGISDFMAKAGLFYGMSQAISEVKQQLENCFEQAKKFDQAFTDISITMDITKAQFADMSDKITQMGVEYGRSGNEIMNIARTYANAQSSIDEVMAKVKPDLWLANVSRIDSADITKTLNSVVNQFGLMTKEGMNAEEATTKVGNSLVATSKNMQFDFVDGIKKITEAVKTGGSVAENAKMSLDDFISMTGAFVQQSGQSGAEFANSLKMISARILQQKDLGEQLGISEDEMKMAEKTLDRYNISIREGGGQLRSLTDILRDTSKAFEKMSDSDRQYVANKLAGVNQSARFIDIMKSMNNQQLLYNATQTDTTALMDAQAKYSSSLEGRLGSLKATYEGLMNKAMNSDTAKALVSGATELLNVLSQVDGKTIAFIGTIGTLIVIMSKLATLNKTLIAEEAVTGLSKFIALASGMTVVGEATTGLGTAFTFLGTSLKGATVNALAFMATPIGTLLTAITAVVGVAIAGFTAYKEHQAELTQQSKELREALEGVNTALSNGDTKTASQTADKMRQEQKALTDLINTRKKLEEAPEPDKNSFYSMEGGATKAQSIALVTSKIDEQIKKIKEAGMTVDETTGKIQQLQQVESQIVNQNIVDKIKAETKAQIDQRENVEANTEEYKKYIETVQSLYSEYQNLESQENLSAEQKQELSSIVEQLQGKVGNLSTEMDSNGKVYITNQVLIQDTISYLNSEGQTVETLTQIKLADEKSNATWQYNNTSLTYTQTLQRIQYYRSEIAEIQKLMQARLEEASSVISHKDENGNYDTSPDRANQAEKEYMIAKRSSDARIKNANDQISELQAGINNIDKLYNSMSLPAPSKSGGGYLSANPDTSTKKGKGSGKSAETIAKEEHEALVKEEKQKVQDVLDIYNDAKNQIENNIGEIDYNIKMLGDADGSNATQRVDLINKKLGEQRKVADEAQSQLDKLKNTTVSTSEAQKELTAKTLSASKELRDEKLAVADLQKQLKDIEKDTLKKYFETEQKEKQIELEVKQKKDSNDLTKTIFGVSESDWNSYISNKKEQINNEISDLQERANDNSDNVSALDAIKVKQQELNDLEKQSYNNRTDFQQVYEDIHKQRVSDIDEELKALEKTHDAEKKENDLLEKKKSLTEAQIALDKAKNDKSVYQYKKNEQTGVWDFEWVVNEENVKTAQDTYDKAKKDYDTYVKDQDYEKKKSDLEQQKADEETILNTKKDSYDKQQKVLEKSQELEKTTLENHYSDMNDLIQKEMDGYIKTYGDNWKTIVDNTNKSFEEIEKKYKELSTMKATVGLDKMADTLLDNTTVSADGTKDVYGKINGNKNNDLINNQSEIKVKEELQKYNDNLQDKLDIMVKYSNKMLTVKEAFEKAILTLQNNSQKAQYDSLTNFAIKYSTFTDKFLEMLQLIYDFRYTNIVNISSQMQDLIKTALLSCEEAYKDFVKMSSAMGIDVDASVDISSALSQMEKYKQSVADWTKTKEDMYKNEKNNPLTNPTSLSDYEAKYNSNANDITKNPLYDYSRNPIYDYAKMSELYNPELFSQLSSINLSSLSSFGMSNLSSQLGTVVNKNSTSSITNYQIDKIEMTATDDPVATFNSIVEYANQKAVLKS